MSPYKLVQVINKGAIYVFNDHKLNRSNAIIKEMFAVPIKAHIKL